MATLINKDRLAKHSVSQYTFKSLGGSGGDKEEEYVSAFVSQSKASGDELEHVASEVASSEPAQEEYTEENNPNRRASDNIDSSSLSKGSKDALIESLMKKTDEMSSN